MSEATIEVAPLTGTPAGVRLRVSGTIDEGSVDDIGSRIDQLKQEAFTHVALALDGVGHATSGGISELANFYDDIIDDGGDLVLLSPSPKVERVLDMLGMHDFFKTLNNEGDVARFFQGEDVEPSNVVLDEVDEDDIPIPSSSGASTARRPAVGGAAAGGSDRPTGKVICNQPQSRISDAVESPLTDAFEGSGGAPFVSGQTMKISRDRIIAAGADKPEPKPEPATSRGTGRYAVAGYAKPYVDDPQPPHGYTAPEPKAPQVVECPNCHTTFKIAQTGKFRCPSCNTSFMVDKIYGPELVAATSQLALQFTPECREGLSLFLSAMMRRAGFGARLWSHVVEALNEVLSAVLEESYENQVYSTFTIAFTPERRNLQIRVGCTGKRIQTSAQTLFPKAVAVFNNVDVKVGSKGGSIVSLGLVRSV